MTERLQARSKKTTEELIQSLIVLCKDKQVFTYMDDINKKKDTLYNPGSDLSTALTTFLDQFCEEVVAEYSKILLYDKTKQLHKDNDDLTSVIAAVNTMVENDKETLCKNVQKIYYAKYKAKLPKQPKRNRRVLGTRVPKTKSTAAWENHGVLMRF